MENLGTREGRVSSRRGGSHLIAFLIVAVLLTWGRNVGAVVLEPGFQNLDLTTRVEVLEDPTAAMGLAEAAAPERASGYRSRPRGLNAGYTRSAFWARITLEGRGAGRSLLELGKPYLDELDVFLPNRDGGFDHIATGAIRPFSSRPLPQRDFVFPVRVDAASPTVIYARFRSTSTVSFQARIWEPDAFAAAKSVEGLVYGLLNGAFALVLVLAALWFVATRNPVYGYWCLYVFCSEAVFLGLNGLAGQFLFPDAPRLATALVHQGTLATVGAGVLVSLPMLDVARRSPTLHRIYRFVGFASFAAMAADMFGRHGLVAGPIQVTGVLIVAAQLVHAGWLAARGERGARVYIAAFGMQIVTFLLIVARNVGLIDIVESIDLIVQVSGLGQVVLITVGLVNQAASERARKAATQAELLDSARRDEREMARRVEERTAELRAALDTQGRLMREQRNFLAMVSHEFRTPISVITAAAAVLGMPRVAASLRTAELAKIGRSVRRMTEMIDAYLNDEWLDGSIDTLRTTCLDVREIIGTVRDELAGDASARVRLEGAGAPIMVDGDERLLRILFGNLIDNGLKYAEPDGRVTIGLARGDGVVRVEVADDGRGVSDRDRARIFEKFYRAETAVGKRGAGLGLYLARRIAERHGGSIDLAARREGEGARFIVTLPPAGADAPTGSPLLGDA